ncbi:probable cytochrome P450 301a1, mitochondrial [Panulirus ornatus]|uniref:probable cytochrome P450 301a1, mitochondrial n=1 Tax=Panulirus ornatus TaxID=150431 RepID=UPI003A8B78F9
MVFMLRWRASFATGSLLWSRCIATTSVQQELAARDHQPTAATAARPTHEIPGPKTYPIIGTIMAFIKMMELSKDRDAVLKMWMNMIEHYGPIIHLKQPGIGQFVTLVRPEDIETVMLSTMEDPIRYGLEVIQKIRKTAPGNYFEKKCGIVTENGEEWRRVRSKVQKPTMRPKNVTSYLTRMDQVTLDFIDRIAAWQAERGEMPKDFQTELYKWAFESTCLMVLNRRMGCLDPDVAQDSDPMRFITIATDHLSAMHDTLMTLPFWKLYRTSSYKRLEKTHHSLLQIADRNIRKAEEALLSKDPDEGEDDFSLLQTLLLTPGLTHKDVYTYMFDLLSGSIHTTSHTIGFTLYLLARHPEVQARLQEELDNVLGDHQGPLTPKHLAQLSYLKTIIKESLRIFPVMAGSVRLLNRDVVLSGYMVPKGYKALILNHLSGWDEKYFPQADKFIPERWLRHKPLGPIHPYASLPFGTGTRMCIARRIAEQEMYTFLARVMHRFTIHYKYEDMQAELCLLYRPSLPLKFNFSERK